MFVRSEVHQASTHGFGPTFSRLVLVVSLGACGGRTIGDVDAIVGAAGGGRFGSGTHGGGDSTGRMGQGGSRGDPATTGAGGRDQDGGLGNAGSAGSSGAAGGSGGALVGDLLDPDKVYLAGTLEEGACYRDALASWAFPNTAVTGFGCYFDGNASAQGTRPTAQIRPTDGRLIYANTAESLLREFHCDVCPFVQGNSYPDRPLANDTIVPTDCKIDSGFGTFLVSPEGAIVYYCTDLHEWHDASHRLVYADSGGDPLIHLGYGDTAITRTRVVDLVSGAAIAIKGLPDGFIYAIRAEHPDKFALAIRSKDTGGPDALWEIDATGLATLRGQYPPIPPYARSVGFEAQLESGDALLQFGSGPAVFEDIIVRRSIDGASEVVYTEAKDPLVKIHISGLITGP